MCAAGFGTTSCSACRTGTTSVAALIAAAECSMCTNDADGCWGHGTCATDTGACTCASGWTGDSCGLFDTSIVDVATTVTALKVDTGTIWNADFADATSAASVALSTSVSDAATATFAASAADGFILKSVDVTLSQSEDTSKDSFKSEIKCGFESENRKFSDIERNLAKKGCFSPFKTLIFCIKAPIF